MTRLRVVDHEVLAGKYQPKGEQHRVEEALSDILQQRYKWQVKVQGEQFDGHIQNCQSCADREQHILEQNRLSVQLVNTVPEPKHGDQDKREEGCLHGPPDSSEAAILVDSYQSQVAQVTQVRVHLETNVQQVEIVVQRAQFEKWHHRAAVRAVVRVWLTVEVPFDDALRVQFPVVVGVAIVPVAQTHIHRKQNVRRHFDHLVVDNFEHQNTDEVLLPARVVEDLAIAWKRYLEGEHDFFGYFVQLLHIGMVVDVVALTGATTVVPVVLPIVDALGRHKWKSVRRCRSNDAADEEASSEQHQQHRN